MKISEAVIQNRNISVNIETNFVATYKGYHIFVTTKHDLGKPKYAHLKRYSIDVINIKTGLNAVQTWEDHHNMKDAIRSALKVALLIS